MARHRKAFQRKTVPIPKVPAPIPTRFSRFRTRAAKFVSTSKRKALAIGLAGALVLGSYGAYKGIEAYRFHRFREGVALTVHLGRHDNANDLYGVDFVLSDALQKKQPFDFLVLERFNQTHADRIETEKSFNDIVRFTREQSQTPPFSLSHLNPGELAEVIFEVTGNATRSQKNASFIAGVLGLAAKYQLQVKMAEEYPAKKLLEMESEAQAARTGTFFGLSAESIPTKTVVSRLREEQEGYDAHVKTRDRVIAQVIQNSAAELRRDNPSFRGRSLRGLVILGPAHFGVVSEAKRKPPRRFAIDVVSSINAQFPIEISIAEMAGGFNCPNRQSVGVFLQPYYHNMIRRENIEQAQRLVHRISLLSEKEAALILRSVWNLTGKERAEKILQQLPAAK